MKVFAGRSCRSVPFLLLASTLLFCTAAVQAATYYVSPSGSDSNAGTSTGAPFKTIQKAASIMVAGDTCYIRAGTYRETVTPANNGTASAPITFAPYSGEKPIISGANLLSATWTVHSGSIYRASTTATFNQLFLDGNMVNEARWPHASINGLLDITRDTVGSTNGSTNITSSALPNVNLIGAKVHVFPGTVGGEYVAYSRPITAHDLATKTISWTTAVGTTIRAGNPYYVFGSLNLLDSPGEWFLDDAADTLYFWCPNNTSPATHTVEYKARDLAFALDNKSYIKVQGLFVFGAGISMRNATSCVVDGCNLRYVMHNTSADGFSSSFATVCGASGNGSVWKNTSIRYSSQSGLSLTGTNLEVSNCVITDVDYFPGGYYTALNLSGGGHKVLHNTFTNSGRFLIFHPAQNCEIAYNDLGYGQRLTRDGGATYVYNWNGNGTTLHHNSCHDSGVGIYLDNNTSNFTLYRNICWNNNIGIQLNSPSLTNKAYNNTLMSNPSSFYSWDPTGTLNQAGTEIINNLTSGTNLFATGANAPTTAKNGWYPPVGSNFIPQTGSGAIDTGNLLPPYTDGYAGSAPDIGAYETGAAVWTAGASLAVPPFPGIALMGTSYSVDNLDTTRVTVTGSWIPTNTTSGYWGSNYYTDGNTGSSGGKSVRFTPNLVSGGSYDVYARWTAATNRATNAPIDINHALGTTTLSINQQVNHGRWVYLGTYTFAAGTSANVTIRNDGANGYVVADAVRFVQVSS